MTELSGRSFLIVGASGGLGAELARELHQRGALLTLAGRSATNLQNLGVPGSIVTGDVTAPGVPEAYVQAALDAHQALDGVIYAAGAVAFGSVTEVTDDLADALWKVNTRGWMSVLRAALPALTTSAEAGNAPAVVTPSGVVAEAPTAGLAAYWAAKSALHAFGAAASRELRRSGIRLIDARPGHTETELSLHPLAGERPPFPTGLAPQAVARRIVDALAGEDKDLPSTSFQGLD
ncbi:MAG: SDR family oxidoreductase [Pontimonas sp.]|nr:SDR family oxidoreductase [Pontimonas sp.]